MPAGGAKGPFNDGCLDDDEGGYWDAGGKRLVMGGSCPANRGGEE